MNRTARRVAAGALGAAAVVAAVAAERAAVRRARSLPQPSGGGSLDERPGADLRVPSFDGTEIAVSVVGPAAAPVAADGPGGGGVTFVFAHGFSLDLTTWHYQWRHFSRRHRCVLYDQRGHGRSGPAAGGDYSVEALGRDLLAVLDRTEPEGPVVLVGHSMGGMAILSLAALHPEEFGGRVVGVVLANTAAADLVKETLGGLAARAVALLRAAARPGRVGWILRQAGGPGSDLAFLVARATNFGPGAPASLIDHVTRIAVGTPVEVWTDLLGSLMEMDLRHAMEHVRVPALVLAGDVDRLTPRATAAVLRRGLPDARVTVFQGAGHCAMLERHEEFNQVVEAFVRDLPARGRRERAPA